MFDVLESGENTEMALHTPLDLLFAEYAKMRGDIERIAAYVRGEAAVIGYFLSGAQKERNYSSLSAKTLFELDPAIRSLDAKFWQRAMALTDVLDAMDATKRNEWISQVRDHKTPPFERQNVVDTLRALLAQRNHFFTERVSGLFSQLSEEHLTNQPQGFGRRLIVGWIVTNHGKGFFSANSARCNYLHDLRCVIAKFMGRAAPAGNETWRDISRIVDAKQFGEWHLFDGGAFKIRLYMRGTAHLEVHPEIAWRLNRILANKFPNAIPESFRRKPVKVKVQKEYELHHDLLEFETLNALTKGHGSEDGCSLFFVDRPDRAVIEVLEYLGGQENTRDKWLFEYDITTVITELLRTGVLPEKRSHQYYGTQDSLAETAVNWAEIEDKHSVLEPEAGQGGIADHLPKERTTCVEVSSLHCAVLKAKGYKPECADFLGWNIQRQYTARKLFDRIVMNPPFSDGRAVRHLKHAAGMLAAKGKLVAILPASLRGKHLVDDLAHEWSEVHQNEFQDTNVAVVLLRLSRP